MDTFGCPHCDQLLKARRMAVDYNVRCPHCDGLIGIPAESQDVPAEPQNAVAEAKNVAAEPQSVPAVPENNAPQKNANDSDHDATYAREEPLSRPSKKIDPEELIDMTAMVDIVFFLLIFFLVTSMSAIQSSAPLPRPEAQGGEGGGAQSTQEEERGKDANAIIVKINHKDLIEIDGVPYHDIGDLIVRLHHLRNVGGAETSMLVLGHGDATHGAAVSVLDAGYEVGIDRLRFAVTEDGTE